MISRPASSASDPVGPMSDDERERWDRRYADGDYVPRLEPSGFLVEWLGRLSDLGVEPGRALDVACGTGRNTLALAAAGWSVTGLDVSSVAIDRARRVAADRGVAPSWVVTDLDRGLGVDGGFDLVTVFRYRNVDLWPELVSALAPDGWLLVEHHLQTPLEVGGPPSKAFRLAPQELLECFGALRVVHYSEIIERDEEYDMRSAVARIVVCNGDPRF